MPPLVFKRSLLFLILEGRKTQTRRLKPLWKEGYIYPILDDYSEGPKAYVRITRVWQQRLGDITPEEAKAEGFNNLEEFKATWIKLFGFWQPEIFVYAYEFKLIKEGEPQRASRRNPQVPEAE